MYDDNGNMNEDFSLEMETLVPVIFKVIVFFIMSFQVVIYSSSDFQEYYLAYIINRGDISRKNALINVFLFILHLLVMHVLLADKKIYAGNCKNNGKKYYGAGYLL